MSVKAGLGFTPHVFIVATGEDIATRIMQFAQRQQGHRCVVIMSTIGDVSTATVSQPLISGGYMTVTYEGRFDIVDLSGSFVVTNNDGVPDLTGGLSISLARPDHQVFGGRIGGMLIASSPTLVNAGTFILG